MFASEFCPHCGAPRQEWARFCGKCRNSYDAPPRPSGQPSPARSTAAAIPAAGQRHAGRLIGLVGLIAVIALGALYAVNDGSGTFVGDGSASNADIAPAGQIWFGVSFDTKTFALSGRSAYAKVGGTIALVAHLSQAVRDGEVNLRVEAGGTTVLDRAMSPMLSGDVFGFTYPLAIAGPYQFTITDIEGSALATGVVVAQ